MQDYKKYIHNIIITSYISFFFCISNLYISLSKRLHVYLHVRDDKVRKPHENLSIGVVLCKSANQVYTEYAVRDYNKPMGVATYKIIADMPKEMQSALPDIKTLKKLMNDENE